MIYVTCPTKRSCRTFPADEMDLIEGAPVASAAVAWKGTPLWIRSNFTAAWVLELETEVDGCFRYSTSVPKTFRRILWVAALSNILSDCRRETYKWVLHLTMQWWYSEPMPMDLFKRWSFRGMHIAVFCKIPDWFRWTVRESYSETLCHCGKFAFAL